MSPPAADSASSHSDTAPVPASARSFLSHSQPRPHPSWLRCTERGGTCQGDSQDCDWLGVLRAPRMPLLLAGTQHLIHHRGADCSHGLQANEGRVQEVGGGNSLGSPLPQALSWHRGQDTPLPPAWLEYFTWLQGTLGHSATSTGI